MEINIEIKHYPPITATLCNKKTVFNPITIISNNILQFLNSLNRIRINTQNTGPSKLHVRVSFGKEVMQEGDGFLHMF